MGIWRSISARRARDEQLRQQERIAETLQCSLLLSPLPRSLPGLVVSCEYAAASSEARVGGDFFDTFLVGATTSALIVGDVSGKGLDSAARTAEIKYALRAFLRENSDPGDALVRLNYYVRQGQNLGQYTSEMMIALSIVVVDTAGMEGGSISCAAAGIDPPLLLRPATGQTFPIDASGLPLGASADALYPTVYGFCEFGDLLCLFSDGLTEARRRDSSGCWEFLDYAGVVESARKAARAHDDLHKVGQVIVEHARQFCGGALYDDVCLLLARLER